MAAAPTVQEIGEVELVERILAILDGAAVAGDEVRSASGPASAARSKGGKGGAASRPKLTPRGRAGKDRGPDEPLSRFRGSAGSPARLLVGPGDDAAVLAAGGDVVVTTDSQHEGVHFERDWMTAEALGRRAITVNASDIGAMGGEALGFLAALALPGDTEVAWVERLAAGLAAGAASWGGRVIGGDVARLEERLSINVTAVGRMPKGVAPVRRSGATEGDLCWISGRPGRSAAGRALLAAGYRLDGDRLDTAAAGQRPAATVGRAAKRDDRAPSASEGPAAEGRDSLVGNDEATNAAVLCIRAFIAPEPPIGLGAALARDGIATAMIDLSDGTGIDLARLCKASGVGACLDADVLLADPVLEALAAVAGVAGTASDGRGAVEPWILAGGEDYQLLGAVAEDNREALMRAARRAGCEVRIVGRFTAAAEGVQLARGGVREALAAGGWDHFSCR